MMQSRAHAKQNDREDGLVPWPMVAFRMSQLFGKQVTAHQCRGLHAAAIRKIRKVLAKGAA